MDFVFASLAFIFIMVLFILLANNTVNRLAYFEDERWRDEAARTAVEQLVESPGYPSHWEQISVLEETNLRSLGLVEERNVLSQEKVDRFVSMGSGENYTFIKRVIGLVRYDTQVTFETLDGTQLYAFHTTPPTDEPVSAVSRLAILNGTITVVNVYVW